MIVLDTDHLSILEYPQSDQYSRLVARMDLCIDQVFCVSAVSFEEQARGWLSSIRRTSQVRDQVGYYARLTGLVEFFSRWPILPFDQVSADEFMRLRGEKVRIGTMDLKIASIALANNALLLSANLGDFEQVPGLRVEDWLH